MYMLSCCMHGFASGVKVDREAVVAISIDYCEMSVYHWMSIVSKSRYLFVDACVKKCMGHYSFNPSLELWR